MKEIYTFYGLWIEWKKMGFSKGTLHYMKKNAKSDKPFTLNAHVRERLEEWGQSVSVSER